MIDLDLRRTLSIGGQPPMCLYGFNLSSLVKHKPRLLSVEQPFTAPCRWTDIPFSLALFHSYTKHYRNRLCLVDPMVTNRSRIVTNAHFSWLPKKCNSVHCMAQSVQNVLWHSTQLSEWVRCHHGDLAFQVDDDDDDNDNDNNGNVVDCHPYILVLDILVISSVLARLAPFERSNISN